jgi:hypothetical protein
MERLGRDGSWTLVAVTAVLISGLAVSCSNSVTPTTTSPATVASNTSGTATPVTTETETPRAELKVPTDLINKSADAAQVQLSAAGIPFSTSFTEVEETQVGVVLEVDPVGGTVLSQGDSVRLLVGKRKEPAELRVPTDLVNKTADAAGQQLAAAGIPFTTSFREAEDAQVGVVLEVDPAGGTVLSPGSSVRLLVGKAIEVPALTPIRPGDLGITEIKFIRQAESANCDLTVTAFNHLLVKAEGITVVGYLQMRDQANTRITLDFSQRNGLVTLEPQEYHQFRGDVTFLRGITASYQLQVVQGTTVIDEVTEQAGTCA